MFTERLVYLYYSVVFELGPMPYFQIHEQGCLYHHIKKSRIPATKARDFYVVGYV